MIRHLIKLLDSLDEGTDDCLLFLEDPDVAVDFCVAKLVIVEVPERCWNLVLTLVVEENVECSRVVVDLELGAHRLFDSPQ